MSELNSIDKMSKNLKSFENRLLNNCTRVELFTYIMYYCELCRLRLIFNPFSPFNKQHNTLLDKMTKEYDDFIQKRKEHFNVRTKED